MVRMAFGYMLGCKLAEALKQLDGARLSMYAMTLRTGTVTIMLPWIRHHAINA
jgi:hypothetical protein